MTVVDQGKALEVASGIKECGSLKIYSRLNYKQEALLTDFRIPQLLPPPMGKTPPQMGIP